MRAILIRVGADQSVAGGSWNGFIDPATGRFAYVPIPESSAIHPGMEQPYSALKPILQSFGIELPAHLSGRNMHLDPDFSELTYGDQGERANQIRQHLRSGDLIVFYAGLSTPRRRAELIYAIIGLFVVDSMVLARDVLPADRKLNAHSRRYLAPLAQDIIVRARPGSSGRLATGISIGEFRDRAYRVRHDLLIEWGDLSVKDGYLQRSARLPRFKDAPRFLSWFERQNPTFVQSNN